MSRGYNPRARRVIHTVGPIWCGGDADEDQLLAACYQSSLRLAARHGLATIAFPAISTGIYGFPAERAAAIAVRTVVGETDEGTGALEKVLFCCFDRHAARYHEAALLQLGGAL